MIAVKILNKKVIAMRERMGRILNNLGYEGDWGLSRDYLGLQSRDGEGTKFGIVNAGLKIREYELFQGEREERMIPEDDVKRMLLKITTRSR